MSHESISFNLDLYIKVVLDQKRYDLLGAKIKHLMGTFAVCLELQTEDKPALTFPDG